MTTLITKENWNYKIEFDYEYFLEFIKKNKVNHLFLNKLKFKNHRDFNFKLLNLSELNEEEDMESFYYLDKFALNKDFIQKEKIVYFWNDINRKKWFLFFPFTSLDDEYLTNDFINILFSSPIENNEDIENYYKIFDKYWVMGVWIGIEL